MFGTKDPISGEVVLMLNADGIFLGGHEGMFIQFNQRQISTQGNGRNIQPDPGRSGYTPGHFYRGGLHPGAVRRDGVSITNLNHGFSRIKEKDNGCKTKHRTQKCIGQAIRKIYEDMVLKIYTGVAPASADDPATGTLLITYSKASGEVSPGEVSTAKEARVQITSHALIKLLPSPSMGPPTPLPIPRTLEAAVTWQCPGRCWWIQIPM